MTVSGFLGLLPAAFITGYVTWRSGSVYASVLVHAGLNATATINIR
jgi:membrane protease YdiL (CAAX protease family)